MVNILNKDNVLENKSEPGVRLFLRLAVKLMLCVAVVGTLWVLLQATGERDAVQDVVPSVAFDITDVAPGNLKIVEWANKPLLILHRLPEWNTTLVSLEADLFRDPLSQSSVQPDAALTPYRSASPDWFVAVGLGTGMGCPLRFVEPSSEQYLGSAWPGGFVDTCDATRYDLAGRVFRQQSARRNIVVPEWKLIDGKVMVGG